MDAEEKYETMNGNQRVSFSCQTGLRGALSKCTGEGQREERYPSRGNTVHKDRGHTRQWEDLKAGVRAMWNVKWRVRSRVRHCSAVIDGLKDD